MSAPCDERAIFVLDLLEWNDFVMLAIALDGASIVDASVFEQHQLNESLRAVNAVNAIGSAGGIQLVNFALADFSASLNDLPKCIDGTVVVVNDFVDLMSRAGVAEIFV